MKFLVPLLVLAVVGLHASAAAAAAAPSPNLVLIITDDQERPAGSAGEAAAPTSPEFISNFPVSRLANGILRVVNQLHENRNDPSAILCAAAPLR